MKTTITAAILSAGLALPMAAPAVAQNSDEAALSMGQSMLLGALTNELQRLDIDTSNLNDLTLAEIAEIHTVLSDDESSDIVKTQELQEIVDG